MTGKVLGCEWVGHLERRAVAAGGTEQDAQCVYNAFYSARVAHAARVKKKKQQQSQGCASKADGRNNTARLRAEARKKFAHQLKQCEDTVFCLEPPRK